MPRFHLRLPPAIPPILVAFLVLFLVSTPTAATEKSQPGQLIREPSIPESFNPPIMPPDLPEGFLISGDDFSAQFIPEGVIWHWQPGDEQFAFWVVEIRGTRGQVFWTRSRKTLSFIIDGDRVVYRRTSLIDETYGGDREKVFQTWLFHDNPLWEGGDLIVKGEILTTLEARKERGTVQFYDAGGEWVGPFFRLQAADDAGRVLDLDPTLDGKTVTVTIPAAWLYEINNVPEPDEGR